MGIPATPDWIAKKGYIKPQGDGYPTVAFQFFPDEVSDSKQPNWNAIDIIGRSHPIQGYVNSSPRTLNFNLMFYMMDASGPTPFTRATWLRALAYPNYGNANLIKPPPACHVVLGKIKMTGVLVSIDLTYRAPWALVGGVLEPMLVEAGVSFVETSVQAWGCHDVVAFSDIESS